MKAGKIIAIGAGVIVVALGGAVAVIASIDVNKYKPQIVAAVRDATGRTLDIKGDIKLGVFPNIAASVSGVSFSNSDWGSRKEMVQAGSLSASVALMPLLSGRIEVGRITIRDVDVLLETDRNGKGNWEMGAPGKPAASEFGAGGSKPSGAAGPMPIVEALRLENVKLAYRDGRTGQVQSVVIESFDVATKAAGMEVALRAALNGQPIKVDGSLGAIAELAAPKSAWPVKLKADVAGATIGIDGAIKEPMAGKGYDIKADLSADDLAKLGALAGVSIPALGPIKLTARVSDSSGTPALPAFNLDLGRAESLKVIAEGSVKNLLQQSGVVVSLKADAADVKALARTFGQDIPAEGPLSIALKAEDTGPKAYRVSGLTAKFGGSDLDGAMTANLSGSKPVLTAQLHSQLLDVAKLMPKSSPQAKPAAAPTPASGSSASSGQPGKVIPDTPLPYDLLNMADADIGYRAEQVVLPAARIRNATVTVALKNGDLTLRPAGDLGQGKLNAEAALSNRAKSLNLRVDARDVVLGSLLKESGTSDVLTGGKTALTADLRGIGASPRAIAASLQGQAYLNVGEGELDNRWLNLMSPDIAGGFGKVIGGEKTTRLNCVIAKFDVKDGMANAKSLFTDIVRMYVRGEGNVDFGTEKPSLKLTPTSNTPSLASLVPPLLVQGSFAAPSVSVDPLGVAASAAQAVGSVAGKVGGNVPGLGSVLGAVGGSQAGSSGGDTVARTCADAVALAEGRRPAAAASQPAAKSAAPAPASPTAPAGGLRDAVKGLFGR